MNSQVAGSSRQAVRQARDNRILPFTPDLEALELIKQEDYRGPLNQWEKRCFVFSKDDRVTELTLLVRTIQLAEEEVEVDPDVANISSLCLGQRDGEIVRDKRIEIMGFQRQARAIEAIKGMRALVRIVTEARGTAQLIFPGTETWTYLYNRFMPYYSGETGELLLATGTPSILGYILPLCGIPNMAQDLARYQDNPDKDGIRFVEPILAGGIPPNPANETHRSRYVHLAGIDSEICCAYGYPYDGVNYKCPSGEEKPVEELVNNQDELLAVAFVYLFLLVKRGQTQHVVLAMKKRLSALRQAAGLESLNVEAFCERFVRPPILIAAAERLAFYPNLRAVIFSSVLSNSSPFHDYTREILRDTQLTVFNMIVIFCGAQHLTMLHVIDAVLQEYDGFMDAKEKLVATYGERAWHYCKLINPNENLATLSKFPELARAAKAYIVTTQDLDSLRNLQGMRDVPLPYYQYAGQRLTPAVGVNIEEVRRRLGRIAPADVVENLTEAMLLEGKRNAEAAPRSARVEAFLQAINPGRGE